jgi:MraZ protein
MLPQYSGEYGAKIDDKGRISVPRRFRVSMEAFGHTRWYLTRGFDRCVAFYTHDAWEQIHGQVQRFSTMNAKALDFRRMFFGSVAEAQMDGQGRMSIPPHLREYAGLDKDAVLIGVDDHMELWSKDAWVAFQEQNMADYKEMASHLFVQGGAQQTAEDASHED